MKYQFIVIALAAALSGCSSFSSTLVHRAEDNMAWEKRKLHGVPITLKVPTHVRIDVTEKHFFVLNQAKDDKTLVTRLERKAAKFPIREVAYHLIETEKIFTVDLKRPGAGTINAKVDFAPDDQYFNEIKTKVVDETIDQVGNLISQVAPSGLFGAPTSDAEPGKFVSGRIKELPSVVASKIFEIDSPDFEIQVRAFLGRHLNCCNSCDLQPVDTTRPSELGAPVRLPITDQNGASRAFLHPVQTPTLAAPVLNGESAIR